MVKLRGLTLFIPAWTEAAVDSPRIKMNCFTSFICRNGTRLWSREPISVALSWSVKSAGHAFQYLPPGIYMRERSRRWRCLATVVSSVLLRFYNHGCCWIKMHLQTWRKLCHPLETLAGAPEIDLTTFLSSYIFKFSRWWITALEKKRVNPLSVLRFYVLGHRKGTKKPKHLSLTST